ncbi:MAG: gliding motility-associated C-terminal domain-containing protein [Bacteroidota bacterium]
MTDSTNGCLSTAAFAVTTDTIAPTASIPSPDLITCNADTVTVGTTINSGSGDYTFAWAGPDMGITGPADQAQTTVILEGNYQLTITDLSNGCIAELSTTISLDNAAPELMTLNDTTLNCFNSTITLAASSMSSGSLNFSWEDEDGIIVSSNATVQIDEAGQYTVQVINTDNGCEDQQNIIVSDDSTPPLVDAGADELLGCDDDDITLSGVVGESNWQPSWVDQNGNIVSTDSWSYTTSAAGTYELVVIDLDNGCQASDFATLSLDQSFPIADAGEDLAFDCFANEAVINAGNSSQGDNFSYELYAADGTLLEQSNSSSFTVMETGSYQLSVINEDNNCESSDEIIVTANFPVITEVLANNISCTDEDGNSGSISLETIESGTPPYLYSIDGGNSFQVNNIFNTLSSGTYELVVQDANGCEAQESTSITQESGVSVNLPEQITATWGESITLQPIINQDTSTLLSFSWDASPQLDCDKCLDNAFLANESEVLAFRVTDDMGCSDEAIVRIIVDQRIPIYVPNAFSPDDDGFNDRFTIFGDAERILDIAQFQVYDRWGNTVFSEKDVPINDPAAGWNGTFRGKVLNSNVFVYQIEVRLQNGETTVLTGDILLAR